MASFHQTRCGLQYFPRYKQRRRFKRNREKDPGWISRLECFRFIWCTHYIVYIYIIIIKLYFLVNILYGTGMYVGWRNRAESFTIVEISFGPFSDCCRFTTAMVRSACCLIIKKKQCYYCLICYHPVNILVKIFVYMYRYIIIHLFCLNISIFFIFLFKYIWFS